LRTPRIGQFSELFQNTKVGLETVAHPTTIHAETVLLAQHGR
jgi:hypothetical protein